MIKFEQIPAMRRYRGIPYMNDFQSVKQRHDAWNLCDQDDHAMAPGPDFRREIADI